MNNNMMSDMTGIEVEALKKHYKDKDKRSELEEEDGLLEISGRELKSEILQTGTIGPGLKTIEELSVNKILKVSNASSKLVYSDGYEINLGMAIQNILSLKSVMKLMLMLTQTSIAKEFREFVLNELVLGETAQEIVEGY